jgi:hypothetical protein
MHILARDQRYARYQAIRAWPYADFSVQDSGPDGGRIIVAHKVVRLSKDEKEEGHAVLTVTTDKGDYVLDNQTEDILLWSETGYRFVKRQSQSNLNVWVSLDDLRPAIATATSR